MNTPREIEKKSFEIIERELDVLPDTAIRDIVYRVIHTTADFEYADLIEFLNGAEKAENVLSNTRIYADTSMLVSGVNRNACSDHGITLVNYVHDPEVIEKARENGTTRSVEGISKAIAEGIRVYAIGNAPTALIKLIEEVEAGKITPELIIATPIGFVDAAESKEMLDKVDTPAIRINGRKGGSAVAAAILNSLLYREGRRW